MVVSDAPRAWIRKKPRSSSGVMLDDRVPAAPAAMMANPIATASTIIGARMARSMTASNTRDTRPGLAGAVALGFAGSRNAAITGASVSAVIDDRVTAKASTKPNSLNTPPA